MLIEDIVGVFSHWRIDMPFKPALMISCHCDIRLVQYAGA